MAREGGVARIDRRGAALILGFEGLYLYAYPDPGTGGEPWTIGAGHTRAAGPPAVRRGDAMTLERALAVFRADVGRYERRVVGRLGPLPPSELAALVSFDLNTGAIVSGTVDDRLLAGDRAGAMAVLRRYTRAGGRVMRGLQIRREAEARLFLEGRWPGTPIALRDRPGARPRLLQADQMPWGEGSPAPGVDLDVGEPAPPVPIRRPRDNFVLDLLRLLWGLLRGGGR